MVVQSCVLYVFYKSSFKRIVNFRAKKKLLIENFHTFIIIYNTWNDISFSFHRKLLIHIEMLHFEKNINVFKFSVRSSKVI